MFRNMFLLLTAAGTTVAAAADLPVAAAAREVIAAEHRLDGVVEAVNRATVSAQTSGRIIELPYDVDDYVEKGAVIVRFRDTEQRARFEGAQAALAEARARHAEAEAEFKRVQDIFEQKLVSKAEMDRAQANFDAAKARLTAAQAAGRQAEEQLEQTVVRAPYSGIVVERHVQLGELATVGMPLMTGVSLEHLRIVADVPQSLIQDLRNNKTADVILPGGETLASESLRIYPYADESTHTFRVRVNLPEGQHGVYPGMLVKIAFPGDAAPVLSIPDSALAKRGEVTAVYVRAADGRLHFRQVRIGRVRDGRVEILAGLEEGEQVVTDTVAATLAWKQQRETGLAGDVQ